MSDRPLPLESLPRDFRGALRLVCYALRSLRGRVTADSVGEYRAKNFGDELTTAARGEHRHGMSALVWLDHLAARWSVSLAGDADGRPLAVFLPDGWVPWERAMAVIRRDHLARVVADYGGLCASFAVAPRDDAGDAALFDLIDEPDEVVNPFVPTMPTSLIAPLWHRATWTLTSDLAHGADTKDGNVSRFRTEPRRDPLTSKVGEVPFLSGNAWRGQVRDLLALDMLTRLGLDPARDLAPRTAHALFAGGSIEAGADSAGVNLTERRRWREVPMVDLLGGCYDQQVMAGHLRVQDAIPVCRETAAMVAPVVAPGVDPRELAARLPEARDLFAIRQLTRHAHRDFEGDGAQMLVRTEVVIAGTQFVHAVALTGRTDASTLPLTASCLAHAIDLVRAAGVVGAGTARGHGGIAFDAYQPGAGLAPLPSSEAYLAHLTEHADRLRAILCGAKVDGDLAVDVGQQVYEATPRGKRGRTKTAPKAATEPATPQSDIPFGTDP